MSIAFVGNTSLTRTRVFVFSVVLVASLVAGVLGALLPPAPPARAACGVNNPCTLPDITKTASLTVNHAYDPEYTNVAVEPNDGDTMTITAYWATQFGSLEPFCDCMEVSASVSADVTWSEANHAWSVSCTGCNANGPIRSVGVCLAGSYCGSPQTNNSAAYKLHVDVNDLNTYYCPTDGSSYPAYLNRVVFSTTAVDDGNLINLQACTEGSSVSPTSQTWTETDYGPLECTNDCNQSGPSMTIEYE